MSAPHCYHCGGEARFNANGVWYCAPCGKSPESTCTCPPLAERSPVPHLPAKSACELCGDPAAPGGAFCRECTADEERENAWDLEHPEASGFGRFVGR